MQSLTMAGTVNSTRERKCDWSGIAPLHVQTAYAQTCGESNEYGEGLCTMVM